MMMRQLSLRHLTGITPCRRHCRTTACYIIAGRDDLEEFTGEPCRAPVNFSRYFVIVVCRGECPTGGYMIKVQKGWADEDDTLTLEVELTNPAPGAFVTLAMTYPSTAVAVARQPFGGLPSGVVVRDFASGETLTTLAGL